jgi:hypothetical protein
MVRSMKLIGVDGLAVQLETELPFHKEQVEGKKYSPIVQAVMGEKLKNTSARLIINLQTPAESAPESAAATETSGSGDQLLAAVEAAMGSVDKV